MRPILSIITITNGDVEPLAYTASTISTLDRSEWIIVTADKAMSELSPTPNHAVLNANNGIFNAMNLGLQKASGDLVIFMNAGDGFASREVISTIIDSFLLTRWKWAVGGALKVDSYGHKSVWKMPKTKSLRFKCATNSFCHQSTVISRTLLNSLGGYIENSLMSDWISSRQLVEISDPFDLNLMISNVDSSGVSSKFSLRYRILEPHRLKVQTKLLVWGVAVDFGIQAWIAFNSFVLNIARMRKCK